MCVSIFFTNFSETFLILRRIEPNIIKDVYLSSCNVPVILVRSQWNLNFQDRFSRNTQMPNLMKIRSQGAELFHADSRTDRRIGMTTVIVAFRNFANAPKNHPSHRACASLRVFRSVAKLTAQSAGWNFKIKSFVIRTSQQILSLEPNQGGLDWRRKWHV